MIYTEVKLFKVDRDCHANQIYLRWLNQIAGWEGFLFTGEKDYRLKTEEGQYIPSVDERSVRVLRKRGVNTVTIRHGNLTQNEAEAMKSLYLSKQVYIQDSAGTTTPCTLRDGSFGLYNESETRYVVEFELETGNENA